MRTSWKLASVALLLAFGVSVGLGWGNVTHVWFADRLGVKAGALNHNELYGAVLPDIFGYDFQSPPALAADFVLHTQSGVFSALYGAAQSPSAKAVIYGMYTHSNVTTIKGADYYAHGVYPGDETGWVIQQGFALTAQGPIPEYINQLLSGYPGAAEAFLPVVGHTLIETAVDILVKHYEDPSIGARLHVAAQNRSSEVPLVLANVIAGIEPPPEVTFPDSEYTVTREAQYRMEMIQYGKLFTRPDPVVIAVLSQQVAAVAVGYLGAYGITLDAPDLPVKVAEFLQLAIEQVAPIYHDALMETLALVKTNMEENAPPPAGPQLAFWGKDVIEDEFGGIESSKPTEFSLDQNYPNPFNPTTTIAFALPSDQVVTMKVYNVIGQEVATLVNEFKTAGRYSAVWDAQGIPSGVYFCRLQAGNLVEMKKMALLK